MTEKDGEKFKQNWVDVSEQSRRLVEKNEEIKELRTRVEELEGNHVLKTIEAIRDTTGTIKVDGSAKDILRLTEENDELKKRVAELEKKVEDAERALRIESNEPEERTQEATHYNWLDNQNKELQNRLSEAEDLNEMFRKTYVQPDCQVKRMREQIQFIEQRLISKDEDCKLWMDKYTTLLKASEGMEKALERIVEIPDQTDYEEDPCGQVDAMHEKATKALADFRAVKEGL